MHRVFIVNITFKIGQETLFCPDRLINDEELETLSGYTIEEALKSKGMNPKSRGKWDKWRVASYKFEIIKEL